MIDLIIGAIAMAVLVLLYSYASKRGMKVAWWGWLLAVLGVLYGVFTLEVIIGFLGEGAGQAALVIGLILLVIAAIWGVLLQRFVFKTTAS